MKNALQNSLGALRKGYQNTTRAKTRKRTWSHFFLQISCVPIMVYFIVLTCKHTYLLLSEARYAEELNRLSVRSVCLCLVSLYVWTWESIDGRPTGLEWKHFVGSFISLLIHLQDRFWLCSLVCPWTHDRLLLSTGIISAIVCALALLRSWMGNDIEGWKSWPWTVHLPVMNT